MANEENKTSGTPDETAQTAAVKPPVIWDEKNRLVHDDADAHFKAQHYLVLGQKPPEGSSKAVLDEYERLATEKTENAAKTPANANTAYVTQMQDDYTAEPTTAPMPNSDLNNLPSPISTVNAPTLAREAAIQNVADKLVDRTASIEGVPTEPIREDGEEIGNVQGNPLGAEGGNVHIDLKANADSLKVPVEEIPTGEGTPADDADAKELEDADKKIGDDATLEGLQEKEGDGVEKTGIEAVVGEESTAELTDDKPKTNGKTKK